VPLASITLLQYHTPLILGRGGCNTEHVKGSLNAESGQKRDPAILHYVISEGLFKFQLFLTYLETPLINISVFAILIPKCEMDAVEVQGADPKLVAGSRRCRS
jgi:hypothetical protein